MVKRNTALKLKLRGLTLEQIGQHLECTHQYAWELITGALLEYEGETRENAEELRQIGHLRNEHDVGRLYLKPTRPTSARTWTTGRLTGSFGFGSTTPA